MRGWLIAAALATCAAGALAAEFGAPGGPRPANLGAIAQLLRQDPYDLELLISYGTSKGGSAGHLALALRDAAPGDDLVYSANFYADRDPGHEQHFYTDALMVAVPKLEYLYGTRSSIGDKASFGLDFGEAYKRSVIGVRVFGVPAAEKRALAAFFGRVNDDFRARASNTPYHYGEIKYGYLDLNCAKTIGMGFSIGAGYKDLEVKAVNQLLGSRVVAAANANVPTEMAMKLLAAWHARGYGLDVVLYRKYPGSGWVDPHDDDKLAFKDLPDRFPSVLSRDFRREQGQYEDADNLRAMYLLYNLGRYSVRVIGETRQLEIESRKSPMPYAQAADAAARSAGADSEAFGRRQPFQRNGVEIGAPADGPQAIR